MVSSCKRTQLLSSRFDVATSTLSATPSAAVATVARSGNVGAMRMLRSRGSRPSGWVAPAGVSATPASFASCTTCFGAAVQHVEADEVAALRLGPRATPVPAEMRVEGVEDRRELRRDDRAVAVHQRQRARRCRAGTARGAAG